MKTILDMPLHLTAADSQKNIPVPFFLSEDAQTLYLRFSYAPKTPSDTAAQLQMIEENIERDAPGEWGEGYDPQAFLPLKNLLTLSLDAPNGFRGAAHRQDPQQEHEIGEMFASPGFYPGKIIKGAWRLTVSVHALVTDACDAHLLIATKGGAADEA